MTEIGFKIFSATFSSWEELCKQAITYAADLDVISISHSVDKYQNGTIIVWYRLAKR